MLSETCICPKFYKLISNEFHFDYAHIPTFYYCVIYPFILIGSRKILEIPSTNFFSSSTGILWHSSTTTLSLIDFFERRYRII